MRNKRRNWLMGGIIMIVICFNFIITWIYPFSPVSLYKNYTYQPTVILYNDQTFEEMINAFKKDYENEDKVEMEKSVDDRNNPVVRIEPILQVFEQDWLVSRNPVKMNHVRVDEMHLQVKEWTQVLLNLLAYGNYTTEERIEFVNIINRTLTLDENIQYIRENKYLSRDELNRLFGNLRHQFHMDFEVFVTNFYEGVIVGK